MSHGKLIVLEGIDGSGKSAQYRRLCARMENDGIAYNHIVFPRYDKESSALIRMYLSGQFGENPEGAWKPGDVMEVLVRGGIAVKTAANGTHGGKIYIRKSDGELTPEAGESGTTVLLENVHIRNPRNAYGPCCEVIVNERNVI